MPSRRLFGRQTRRDAAEPRPIAFREEGATVLPCAFAATNECPPSTQGERAASARSSSDHREVRLPRSIAFDLDSVRPVEPGAPVLTSLYIRELGRTP